VIAGEHLKFVSPKNQLEFDTRFFGETSVLRLSFSMQIA